MRSFKVFLGCCVLLFVHHSFAVAETATIRGKLKLPSNKGPGRSMEEFLEVFPTHKVSLDGGKRITYSRADGSFELRNVAPGSYQMEISNPEYFFMTYKVKVAKDGKVRASSHHSGIWEAEELRQTPSQPLVIRAAGKPKYFEKKPQLSILSMFMNPMGMMMAFMMLMAFVMPKMMEGIDPEELKKMQAEQKKNQEDVDPQKLLNGLFGVKQPEGSDSDSD